MHFNPRVVTIESYSQAKNVMGDVVRASDGGQGIMQFKAIFFPILADNLSDPAVNILKQEMLSIGGECAIHRDALTHKAGHSSALLLGTMKQYKLLVKKLKAQPFKLSLLSAELESTLAALTGKRQQSMDCLHGPLLFGQRTLVMGIVNVTPDSFSDGGKFDRVEEAVEQALRLEAEGADIIDIGGESTRPGYQEISPTEELERILPVIRELAPRLKVPISVDTYKAQVAREAMAAGAAMINDIWGCQREPELARVAAEYDCPVILMHNQDGTEYGDMLGEIIAFLRRSLEIVQEAGVKADKTIIDPGIGFGKTAEQNLEVMSRLEELKCLGRPLLLGTSRKSLIGKVLQLPVDDRLEGTAATVAVGIAKGADIVRVHDVREMVRVAKVTDAMVRR